MSDAHDLAGAQPLDQAAALATASMVDLIEALTHEVPDPALPPLAVEQLVELFRLQPHDRIPKLLNALAHFPVASQRLLEALERYGDITRGFFGQLSPIEAVRVLREFDRQDPGATEQLLLALQREDPATAMFVSHAFAIGAHGGHTASPGYYVGYNSQDDITRSAPGSPNTYSFMR